LELKSPYNPAHKEGQIMNELVKQPQVPTALADNHVQRRARETVAEIWGQFRGVIMDRLEILEQATAALLDGVLSDELRQRAEREAHKLVGSAGLFGFRQGSQLAMEIEQMFQTQVPLDQQQASCLAALVRALRQELEQPVGEEESELE
jgi:HPt (histidine-containing phosphotransfer) domain-containing protein